MTAVIEGTATSFTPLEFKLLKLLSLNPNTVLTRQYLLYSLWDRNGNYVEETSLNSMICRIRHRIDTENHHYIKTIFFPNFFCHYFSTETEKKGMWKNLIEFFCIPLFAFVVYKLLESYAEKAHSPYPIEILFLNLCGSSISHLFVLIFV